MPLLRQQEACLRAPRIKIRRERRGDVAAREQLLDAAFGAGRFTKSSERLREGQLPARGLAFVALDSGHLIGTIRLWSITAGRERPCLLLGPLAVDADAQNRGVGAALMHHAMRKAAARRYSAVVLVGDPDYYRRFGFSAAWTGALHMPGPFERHRLLACEFVPGALQGAHGLIAVNRPPRSRLSRILDGVDYSAPAIPHMA